MTLAKLAILARAALPIPVAPAEGTAMDLLSFAQGTLNG